MSNSPAKLLGNVRMDPQMVAHTFTGPVAIVNADFDGDGKLDLAVLDVFTRQITVFKGDGRGGFRPVDDLPTHDRRREDQGLPERLTPREAEVARLLGSGLMDREIATMLGIGRRTVETHAANVRAKLGLKSRRELIRGGIWPAA